MADDTEHDFTKSPHASFSSAWCERCTQIGLHPANTTEIRSVVFAERAGLLARCRLLEAERNTAIQQGREQAARDIEYAAPGEGEQAELFFDIAEIARGAYQENE